MSTEHMANPEDPESLEQDFYEIEEVVGNLTDEYIEHRLGQVLARRFHGGQINPDDAELRPRDKELILEITDITHLAQHPHQTSGEAAAQFRWAPGTGAMNAATAATWQEAQIQANRAAEAANAATQAEQYAAKVTARARMYVNEELDRARTESQKIMDQARESAEQLLASARQEAERIIAAAHTEVQSAAERHPTADAPARNGSLVHLLLIANPLGSARNVLYAEPTISVDHCDLTEWAAVGEHVETLHCDARELRRAGEALIYSLCAAQVTNNADYDEAPRTHSGEDDTAPIAQENCYRTPQKTSKLKNAPNARTDRGRKNEILAALRDTVSTASEESAQAWRFHLIRLESAYQLEQRATRRFA